MTWSSDFYRGALAGMRGEIDEAECLLCACQRHLGMLRIGGGEQR